MPRELRHGGKSRRKRARKFRHLQFFFFLFTTRLSEISSFYEMESLIAIMNRKRCVSAICIKSFGELRIQLDSALTFKIGK